MDEQNTAAEPQAASAAPTQPATQSIAEARPQEIYERMAKYVTETDSLIGILNESLKKAEGQLTDIASFDSRVSQLKNGQTPIDTGAIQTNIDDIRKHIASLEEFRERVKADMEKVKQISERISEFISRYQTAS